jgi:hypothetical protein
MRDSSQDISLDQQTEAELLAIVDAGWSELASAQPRNDRGAKRDKRRNKRRSRGG